MTRSTLWCLREGRTGVDLPYQLTGQDRVAAAAIKHLNLYRHTSIPPDDPFILVTRKGWELIIRTEAGG